MTTLITGGNGKTGLNLAALHDKNSKPFLIASRTGTSSNPAYKAVKFDWSDPSTFENPFNAAKDIDKLYLVAPPAADPLGATKPFLELAIQKGLKRIVFLHASNFEKDDARFPNGKIHQYLDEREDIWFGVLKPTWFQDNFRETLTSTIVSNDTIYTWCKDGLVPFVNGKDIAQAAYDGLFAHENGQDAVWPRGRAPRILGPNLLTYDDAAALLTSVLGRKITHVRLDEGAPNPAWDNIGIPKGYQDVLSLVEHWSAEGKEEGYFTGKGPLGNVDKIIGKVALKDYFETEKVTWAKKY